MKNFKNSIVIMLAMGILVSGLLYAKEASGERIVKGRDLQKPTVAQTGSFDGNRIQNDFENNGMIVSQNVSGRSGMSWPVGNNTQTVYASGIWVGGLIGNIPHVSAGEYAGEYVSGPWGSKPTDPQHVIFKVNKADFANPLANPHFQNWPTEFGAPWVDVDGDGSYNPLPGGPDHPEFIGDQVIWFVVNDGDPTAHGNVFGTNPLGLEMQITLFGFDRPDAFGDMMFVKALLINKGKEDIVDTYIGLWSDPDLGDAADDFVGCVPDLGLGICYNDGEDHDFAGYAGGTPAVGYDFFQGPIVPAPGETALVSGVEIPDYKNLSMTSFSKYINAPDPVWSDPNTAAEAYNLMKGLMKDGTPFADNLTGGTPFVHPGDPNLDTGPTDQVYVDQDIHASGDRRFLMNAGPFTMKVGDRQEVVFAIFHAAAGSALDSYSYLKEVDEIAQLAYDTQFALPPSPPKPEVSVTTLPAEIVLIWDDSAESYVAEDVIDRNPDTGETTEYVFEGYNVWQFETISGSGAKKLLATYDVINGLTEIYDDVFDPKFGEIINRRVQFGSDSGLKRSISIDSDVLSGGIPLKTNRVYYFAVNAYGYNPYGIPVTLESPPTILAIRPQISNTQVVDDFALTGSAVDVVHDGPSQGSVNVSVIDPTQVVDASYSVVFAEDLSWSLLRGSEVLETGLTNQSGNDEYPIFDGIQAQVIGPPLAINDWDYDGNRWMGGVNWGGAQFFGGMDLGANFFGSTGVEATDYVPVFMEFQDAADVAANGNAGFAYSYRRDLGYAYAGIAETPFTVWETDWETMTQKVRQLNVAIVEDANDGVANLLWDMGWDGSAFAANGGREYIFLMTTTYDIVDGVGTTYDDVNWGPSADVLYAIWPQVRGGRAYLLAPFTFTVWPNRVNTTLDTFTWSTVAAESKEYNPDDINVWPNPYFGYNPEERDPIDQILQFTHLPESGSCTIRIFNIAGVPVRTINHTDGTQFEIWDLKNNFRIPVSSGMYIAVVETDKGSKVLKLAIIQPEQRLDVY
jgi:hypothetical protein